MQVLIIIFLVILAIFAKLVIPPLMIRRALRPVLEQFVHHGALNPDNAKTPEELGLGPRTMIQRLATLRDYKPKALDVLLTASIVVITEEGKFYLSKEKLQSTGILDKWPALAERIRSCQESA
jgi:hypothetical protein